MTEATQTAGRSEQDIALQQITFHLAGENHTVSVKPIRQMAAFRSELGKLLGKHAANIFAEVPKDKKETNWVSAALLSELMGNGLDTLMELPHIYAPELKDVCARATEQELISAGMEVLELIFPLVEIVLPGILRITKIGTKMGLSLG